MILQIDINGITAWSHKVEESDNIRAWVGEPTSDPLHRVSGIREGGVTRITLTKAARQALSTRNE